MATSFAAQVAGWVANSERSLDAVVKESAQRVFELAQTPVGQGGKTPVDTGFMRASFLASLTGMPSGPTDGDGAATYSYDGQNVTLTIAGMRAGDTIYAGWTANYAPFMEHRYGFMRSAAQQWQPIVTQVVAELGARTR